MKKLFYLLLRHYANRESGRLEILEVLHEKVTEEYSEQTTFGNVYNYYIEFLMSNSFVKRCVREEDHRSLTLLRKGIDASFNAAMSYLFNDNYKK